MKIISEPRYKDFNGKVHKTEQECIHAEDVFTHKVFRILDELARGCKDHGTVCEGCPFFDKTQEYCSIAVKIGIYPSDWLLKEEE